MNLQYKKYDDSLDRENLQYIQEISGDQFYRIYVDEKNIAPYLDNLNLNQSLNYGYKSITSYDSTYEASLTDFIRMNGINNHIVKLTNPEVMKMLAVRYFLVLDEKDLPEGYNFKYICNNNNFKVYELVDYNTVGFTFSKFTTNREDITENNKWNKVLLVDDELYKEINDIKEAQSSNINLSFVVNNNLVGDINIDNKQVLFISIPYSKGWRIKDNGENIETHKVQGGFIGIVLNPGYHKIELNFIPPGFKIGFIVSAISLLSFVYIIYSEKKKRS